MELVINDCEDEGCWCGDDHKNTAANIIDDIVILNDHMTFAGIPKEIF